MVLAGLGVSLSVWARLWIVAGALGAVGCGTLDADRAQLLQFQALCNDLPPSAYVSSWVIMPPLSGEALLSPEESEKQTQAMVEDAIRSNVVERLRVVCGEPSRANPN